MCKLKLIAPLWVQTYFGARLHVGLLKGAGIVTFLGPNLHLSFLVCALQDFIYHL